VLFHFSLKSGTRFFYKQHFWVEPRVATFVAFEPQSCLLDPLELLIISLLQAKVVIYFCHFFLIWELWS